MYCAVFRLADDTIERDFLDELPTAKEIRSMENDYSIYVKLDNRAYYNDTERRPAKIVNVFKIGNVMSKEEQDLLYYKNRCHQLEQLLEAEKVKNFGLRRLLAEIRFASLPFLNKIQNINAKVKE